MPIIKCYNYKYRSLWLPIEQRNRKRPRTCWVRYEVHFLARTGYILLTAIGLTPGGSSTVHIYTQTIYRITQWNRIHRREHTYLLTPWYKVLLEKLTDLQLVKKFPAFHGTRRFITALKSVRQLSLSWASPIQSIYPHPTSWRSVLILSTNLRLGLPSGLFPSGFPTKTLYTPNSYPYAPHAQPISFFSILSPHNIGWGVQNRTYITVIIHEHIKNT